MILVLFGLIFNMLNANYKEDMLQDSKEVYGILIATSPASHNFTIGDFYYFVGKKKYVLYFTGDFSYLKKGDTVLLKYSLKDPSIAVVSDRYFMKKYWYLRGDLNKN